MITTNTYTSRLAKEFAGNWQKFECFACRDFKGYADPSNWGIYYFPGRNGVGETCRQASNNAYILNAMREVCGDRFGYDDDDDDPEGDLCFELPHRHWAVGYVEGIAIRVCQKDGTYTPAFIRFAEIMAARKRHPLLDEDDYDRRVSEYADTRIKEEMVYEVNKLDLEAGQDDTRIDALCDEFRELHGWLGITEDFFPYEKLETFVHEKFQTQSNQKKDQHALCHCIT